jgi:uncharacterized ion transporter superfamily protein YfcC
LGISQFSAIFLAAAVIIGLVGGLGVNGTARTFVKGCSGMAYAALVIGMARSISVVMQQGNIIDTVIYCSPSLLQRWARSSVPTSCTLLTS